LGNAPIATGCSPGWRDKSGCNWILRAWRPQLRLLPLLLNWLLLWLTWRRTLHLHVRRLVIRVGRHHEGIVCLVVANKAVYLSSALRHRRAVIRWPIACVLRLSGALALHLAKHVKGRRTAHRFLGHCTARSRPLQCLRCRSADGLGRSAMDLAIAGGSADRTTLPHEGRLRHVRTPAARARGRHVGRARHPRGEDLRRRCHNLGWSLCRRALRN